jgi:hypothetical protein
LLFLHSLCQSGHSGILKKRVLTISLAIIAAVREPAVLKSNEGQSGRLVELLKHTILISAPLCNKLILLRPKLLHIAVSSSREESRFKARVEGLIKSIVKQAT